MTIDYKALANAAAERDDQTETKASFERSLPPAGPTVGRLVEYIELGMQARKAYKGKEKKPVDAVRVTFDLLHPEKNVRKGEGEYADKVFNDRITVTMSKLLDGKAAFKKLFNTMQRGRENIKHMAQMLGEPFIITVLHNKSQDGTKTYANIKTEDGTWLVAAPVVVDALAGTAQDISGKIAPPISPIRIFLWDNPTKETWDSLFIDGTYTRKNEKGVEEEVSKNFIQSKIVTATNFEGSPLEGMLGGMPDLPTAEEEGEEPETGDAAAEAAKNFPDTPAQEPVTEEENDDEEAKLLAQLEAAKAKKAAANAKKQEKAPEPAKIAPSKAADKAPATKAAPKPAAPGKPGKATAKDAAKDKPKAPTANDALAALGLT